MENTFPAFKTLDKAPRYPGKKYPGIIAEARNRVRGKAKGG